MAKNIKHALVNANGHYLQNWSWFDRNLTWGKEPKFYSRKWLQDLVKRYKLKAVWIETRLTRAIHRLPVG